MKRVFNKEDSAVSEIIGTLFVFVIIVGISSAFVFWYVPFSGTTYDNQYELTTKQALSGFSNQLLSKDIQNNSIIYQNVPLGIQGDFFSSPTPTSIMYSNNFNVSMQYNVTIEATFSGNTPPGEISNKLVGSIPVDGQNPNGVVVDTVDNLIFVLNSNYSYDHSHPLSPEQGGITVLSGATDYYNRPVGNLSLFGYPTGISFDPKSDFLFVAQGSISSGFNFNNYLNTPAFQTGFMQVIDVHTMKVVHTVYFSSVPYDVTYVPYLNTLMMTIQYYNGGGAVDSLNATTFAQTGYITVAPSGSPIIPSSISYDPANGYVYVALGTPDGIAVINPITDDIVDNIITNAATTPWSLAYDTSDGYIFATNSYAGPEQASTQLLIVNGANNQLVTSYSNLNTPTSLVYDRANHYVYVADYGNSNIEIYDGTTGRHVGIVNGYPIGAGPGNGPNAMDWNPITGQIFVPNWNAGTVSIISGSTSITNQFASADNNFKPVDNLKGSGQIQAFGNTQFTSQNYYDLQDGTLIQQGSGNAFSQILGNLPLDITQNGGLVSLDSTIVNLFGAESSVSQSGNYLLSGTLTNLNLQSWTHGLTLNFVYNGQQYSATVTSILLNSLKFTINTTSVAAWNYSIYEKYNPSSNSYNPNPAGTIWQFSALPITVRVGTDSIIISTNSPFLLQAFQFDYVSALTDI